MVDENVENYRHQPPDHLFNAVENGSCVLFAGAGISLGTGLPSWRALVKGLIERVGDIEPRKAITLRDEYDAGHLLRAAQYAKDELGPHEYFQFLGNILSLGVAPHVNHDLICSIPFRAVITTNFDKLIETAFTLRHRRMPTTFTGKSLSALASGLYANSFFLFKLHGDIDQPESIVLTRQDFDQIIYHSPHIKTFLHSMFARNTILYVGYSLNDPDFDLILGELAAQFAGNTPVHYALLPEPDPLKAQELKTRFNIRALPYDPADEHAAVTNFLEALRDRRRRQGQA
jgi:hypothetical protein